MFVATISYFVSFILIASQIVSETLTKTDFYHLKKSKQTDYDQLHFRERNNQTENSTGRCNKCNRNWKRIYSFISILILLCLYGYNAIVSTIHAYTN